MIKLTLKQLNDSYKSLTEAADCLTAGKMKYRFARVLNSAKGEVELMASQLAQVAQKHGATLIGGDRFEFDSDKQRDDMIAFNKEADSLLKSETVELWGDRQYFKFDEVEKACDPKKPFSAAILADLFWLISDEEIEAEQPKAATATA